VVKIKRYENHGTGVKECGKGSDTGTWTFFPYKYRSPLSFSYAINRNTNYHIRHETLTTDLKVEFSSNGGRSWQNITALFEDAIKDLFYLSKRDFAGFITYNEESH
jgi:hypothetical protein